MRTKDDTLRRQALEKGKTMSRKAARRLDAQSVSSSPLQSPAASQPGSRAGSRANSRAPSRVPSVAGSSDGRNSSEDLSEFSAQEEALQGSSFDSLVDYIESRDFFKADTKARATTLRTLANSVSAKFLPQDLHLTVENLCPVLLRCLKDSTSNVTQLALRALAAIAITCGDDGGDLFAALQEPLQNVVYDTVSASDKAAALRTLATVAYFGGAEFREVLFIMDIYVDIVQSDGEHVSALDSAEVVVAAVQEWSFLSTLVPADPKKFSVALESFGDQLQSSAPAVVCAAAEAIALIYEAAYSIRAAEDTVQVEDSSEDVQFVARPYQQRTWTKSVAYQNKNDHDIAATIKDLSKSTMRGVKKGVRKEMHSTLRDVAHSLEHPWRGPQYRTTIRDESEMFHGHRLTVAGHTIDRWWKWHRAESIRRVLHEGLVEHWMHNPAVADSLRRCLEAPSRFKQNSSDEDQFLDDEMPPIPEQPGLHSDFSDESDEEDHGLEMRA